MNAKIFLFAFLSFLFITLLSSYFLYASRIEEDKKVLLEKVEKLLNGKFTATDFAQYKPTGSLEPVISSKYVDERGYAATVLSTSNREIINSSNERMVTGENDPKRFDFENWEKNKEIFTKLKDYFVLEDGGFTILTLKRKESGYDLVTDRSTNAGYLTDESSWVPPVDLGYGYSSAGYYASNDRIKISDIYKKALHYLTEEKNSVQYAPGTYEQLLHFDEMRSDNFKITDTVFPENKSYDREWLSGYDANISTSNWVCWYKTKGKHYEVVEIGEKKQALALTYAGFSLGLSAICSFILSIIFPTKK